MGLAQRFRHGAPVGVSAADSVPGGGEKVVGDLVNKTVPAHWNGDIELEPGGVFNDFCGVKKDFFLRRRCKTFISGGECRKAGGLLKKSDGGTQRT